MVSDATKVLSPNDGLKYYRSGTIRFLTGKEKLELLKRAKLGKLAFAGLGASIGFIRAFDGYLVNNKKEVILGVIDIGVSVLSYSIPAIGITYFIFTNVVMSEDEIYRYIIDGDYETKTKGVPYLPYYDERNKSAGVIQDKTYRFKGR
jgi:hypothetical protein